MCHLTHGDMPFDPWVLQRCRRHYEQVECVCVVFFLLCVFVCSACAFYTYLLNLAHNCSPLTSYQLELNQTAGARTRPLWVNSGRGLELQPLGGHWGGPEFHITNDEIE